MPILPPRTVQNVGKTVYDYDLINSHCNKDNEWFMKWLIIKILRLLEINQKYIILAKIVAFIEHNDSLSFNTN